MKSESIKVQGTHGEALQSSAEVLATWQGQSYLLLVMKAQITGEVNLVYKWGCVYPSSGNLYT